jgi:hypothetical protein
MGWPANDFERFRTRIDHWSAILWLMPLALLKFSCGTEYENDNATRDTIRMNKPFIDATVYNTFLLTGCNISWKRMQTTFNLELIITERL